MPRLGGALDVVQVADPATPVAGRQFLYFKSDGLLYTKKSDGSVVTIGSTPSNMATTDTTQTISGAKTFSSRTTVVGGAYFDTGSGFGTWLDMGSGLAGIGDGGVGQNAWVAKAAAAGQWYSNAAAGDIAIRALDVKTLHLGAGAAASTVQITSTRMTASSLYEGANRVYSFGNKVPVSGIAATGTADATTVLRGDGTWAVPSGGGSTAANVVTSSKTTANKLTVANLSAPPSAPTTGDLWMVSDVATQGVNAVSGQLLAMASNSQSYTTPSSGVYTDVPGMTMLVPGGVPWTCDLDIIGRITTFTPTAPPAGTAMTLQFRVVDAATSSAFYGYVVWQMYATGVVNASYVQPLNSSTPNEPLAADTVMKLQIVGTNNGNSGYMTYNLGPGVPGCVMKAVRA